MSALLLFLQLVRIGLLNISIATARRSDETEIKVPTSCIGQTDGEYFLKPNLSTDRDSVKPLLYARCSNEYMIIDINKDPQWMEYFTSFSQWHYDIGGPNKNDRVNYNEWFMGALAQSDTEDPSLTKHEIAKSQRPTKYLISPSCDVCEITDHYHQQYGDKTAYYMNAAAYGLFFGVRRPACDFQWDSLQCKYCEHSSEGNMVGFNRSYALSFEDKAKAGMNVGVCLTEVRSAYQYVTKGFEEFTGYGPYTYKPSIGMKGRFCQCVQTQTEPAYVTVTRPEYEHKLQRLQLGSGSPQSGTGKASDDISDVYYLYQSDFEVGTYQITKSGTYILMEDISINFNSPPVTDIQEMQSPNDPNQDWWWPPTNDEEILQKYPGSGYKAREPYMLGYFAGISIEANGVILDLNGFQIGQSKQFFFQQPFFAVIELMSQPFLPNQGPGFFGADPKFAKNVVIKNGVIGRSSHHGIHGTKNHNIRIENVKIKNFMTHGIQMNGYQGLHLQNVEIGPTTNEAFLNHNYAHLRMLLPYLHKLANYDPEHLGKTIAFDPHSRSDNGRKYTLNDLIDIALPKLDKVFKYVVSDDFDKDTLLKLCETDEDFQLYINAGGLPYGAVVYGFYSNYAGSGIFGWDVSDQRSNNLYIKNLEIHDLRHSGQEVFGLSKNKKRFVVNTLLAPINLVHLLGSKEMVKQWVFDSYNRDKGGVTEPHYVGTINTDIFLAQYKFGSDRFDEWWLGTPYLGLSGRIIDWVEGNDIEAMSSAVKGFDYYEPICAIDGMVHPGKGLIGMKLTNVDNVVFDGHIKVYNLFDTTGLAEEGICIGRSNGDQIEVSKVVGSQQPPYQIAYSMNQIFGISAELSDIKVLDNADISLNNFQSWTGRVLGFASWYSTKIRFAADSKLQINDLFAGIAVEADTYAYLDMPNHKSEACSFAVFDGKETFNEIDTGNLNIEQFCIKGNCGCFGSDVQLTNIGKINQNLECRFEENEFLINLKGKSDFNVYSLGPMWMVMGAFGFVFMITKFIFDRKQFKYIPIH